MKILLISFVVLCCSLKLSGQAIFTQFESGIINASSSKKSQPFGGISGIENLGAKNWVLVSDRGYYFNCNNCSTISDFQLKIKQKEGKNTEHWFESVRYDAPTKTYFYSSEYEEDNISHTGVYRSMGSIDPHYEPNGAGSILHLETLPSPNKGVEAIALTPSGKLWVAPEAGWEGEIGMTENYVKFYRYGEPLQNNEKVEFKYPIRRFPEGSYPEDRPGGIAEILAIDETHLLVLERCYVACPQDHVTAFLRNVTVDEENRALIIGPNDAFDLNSIPGLCNVEGMAWGDENKSTLYIIADDGFGSFHNNLNDKPTLKNQLILLKKN
jgi:hypothetical protein